MHERMTREEIESTFDSEHVLLDEPEIDERSHLLGGTVVFHSKNEEEVYRKAAELELKRMTFLYTGKIPEDVVWVYGWTCLCPPADRSSSRLKQGRRQDILI